MQLHIVLWYRGEIILHNDPGLNLNKSKTLALEIKDAGDSDRSFYFGFNPD
jgi:hypothetical protein